MQKNTLDHVTAIPEILYQDWLLNPLIGCFSVFFFLRYKPWKMPDPNSRFYAGTGAFNLLKRSVYQEIHGHWPIAMRPEDDMRLSWLVKKHGYRRGSLSIVIFDVLPLLVLLAVIFSGGAYSVTFWIYAAVIGCMMMFYYLHCRYLNIPAWGVVAFPVSALVFVYIILASTGVTLKDQGITWRGTFYPLSALMAGKFD